MLESAIPRGHRASFRVLLVVLVGLIAASTAAAQTREDSLRERREAKARQLRPPEEPGTAERIVRFVEETLAGPAGPSGSVQPVLGGLRSGAGPTVGVRLQPLGTRDDLLLTLTARASLDRYWGVEGLFGRAFGPFVTHAYADFRHMPREAFYGLGMESSEEDRVTYGLDAAVAGALAGVRVRERVYAGASASYLVHRLGPGRDDGFPTLQDRFGANELPALEDDPEHVALGAWLEVDTRNVPYDPVYGSRFAPTRRDLRGLSLQANDGFYAAVEAMRYVDVSGGAADFTELGVELQEYFPLRNGFHAFVFRELAVLTQDAGGGRVPFYLAPALGGSRTLRGFDEFRFRGRNLVLLNAEYRWYVWLFLDMAVFADAGQVFDRFADLALDEVETTYGLGFRFHSRTRSFGRVDIGVSDEGLKYYVKIGAFF